MDDLVMYLKREMMAEKHISSITKKLVSLKSDEERIKFLLYIIFRYQIHVPDGDHKDPDLSDKFKKDSTKLFYVMKPHLTESNCIEVFKLYNKSITYAPCDSEQLALAYADRSDILFHLKKYELCIQDIDRALQLRDSSQYNGPHDSLKVALSIKRLKCLNELRPQGINDWIRELCRSLKETLRQKLIDNMYSKEKAANERGDPEPLTLPEINSANTGAPYASNAVAIAYNEEHGRHLVATRDIQAGELLIAEEPYTMILAAEKLYSNCYNCFKVTWASIPCDHCTWATYCSEDCKSKNWEMRHEFECLVFPPVFEINPEERDINAFSVRLFLKAVTEVRSLNELMAEVRKVDNWKDRRTKGFSSAGTLTGDRYRNLLGLETNIEKLSKNDKFLLTLQASLVLVCLATRTNCCGASPLLSDLAKNKTALFYGSLIMKNLQLARINGTYMYEEYEPGKWTKYAFGILPFSSLMNRSCNPNTFRRDKAEHEPVRHVVRHYAKNHIKKGEQNYDNDDFLKIAQLFYDQTSVPCKRIIQHYRNYETNLHIG